MQTVGQNSIWSFLDGHTEAIRTENGMVRKRDAHHVKSYYELAQRIAELQFRNPSYVLLFRGQKGDYRDNEGKTILKPSIARARSQESLLRKMKRLQLAEKMLSSEYGAKVDRLGNTFINRYRIVRWSILQHYEVCATPLLDVSHSLRIAASFASPEGHDSEAYVYVVAVPHISGAVTVCAEEGIQTVRLAAVCPPSAMRPHVQEGYLLGEYPELGGLEASENCQVLSELDFGNRLISKFCFDPKTFWASEDFPKISHTALYPDNDPIREFTAEIRKSIRREVPPLI